MQATLKNAMVDRISTFSDQVDGPIMDEGVRSAGINLYALGKILLHAQTVLFPAEQAAVFAELSHEYSDKLDYALPFSALLIEFTAPVPVAGRQLLGIALNEIEFDSAEFGTFAVALGLPATDPSYLPDHAELHQAVGIYVDGQTLVHWRVENRQMLFDSKRTSDTIIKNLAIACIGYINCENVTLERHQADPKINRKRAAKGKHLIEPYYLCRLSGVRYEAGDLEGSSRHASFRFDVRGHFRRLTSGRTIWIRAHQRGLANELYVPKVYRAE